MQSIRGYSLYRASKSGRYTRADQLPLPASINSQSEGGSIIGNYGQG